MNTIMDLEVLALQLRTLRVLFDNLDDLMSQLSTVAYQISRPDEETLLTRVLTSMEFTSHVTTGVAATLAGVLRDEILSRTDE